MEVEPAGDTTKSVAEESVVTVKRARSSWVAWRTLTVPVVILLVLRLPTLFEPHWYTDEAGYANVAYQMAHGKVLYLTTWNNKPPLLFWIYQLGLGISGPRELGIHLLSTLSEAVGLAGTWVLARRYLSPRRVGVAMLLTAFFLATPLLNGDLALPENFLVAFTPWAMVALLAALRVEVRSRAALLAVVAGILFAGAILIQQTALADLAAGCLVLAVVGRRGVWLACLTALVAALAFVLVLTPFVRAAGLHNVIYLLVISYNSYASASLHPSLGSLLPRGFAVLLLVVGTYLGRRWPAERLLPWVWLSALLLAYGLPNRDYLHFLLPAVPAAALLLARARLSDPRTWRLWSALRTTPLLASLGIGGFIWIAMVWVGLPSGSLFTVKLTGEYYPAYVGVMTGALTRSQYVSIYDQRAIAEHEAVDWVRRNHLTGSTAVVWSPDSWAYLLAGLRPILPEPTIYENNALLGTNGVLRRVKVMRPVVVILTSDSYTEYGPVLPVLQSGYTEVQASADGELWIRSDVASRVLTASEDQLDLKRSAN